MGCGECEGGKIKVTGCPLPLTGEDEWAVLDLLGVWKRGGIGPVLGLPALLVDALRWAELEDRRWRARARGE